MPTVDPVDSLIWDEARSLIGDTDPGPVHVLDSAALAAAARQRWPRARAYADLLGTDSHAALEIEGVTLVIGRLPKSLGALEEYAQRIAAVADPGVRLIFGGRIKHMTRSMNDTLATRFGTVRATLGRQKCRALVATDPRPGPIDWPRSRRHPDLGLTLFAHGATFGGTRVDPGTRLLIDTLESTRQLGTDTTADSPAIDVGCGNGTLTAYLARRGLRVLAVDNSRAAIASTRATLTANGLSADVMLADGLTTRPDGSAELIVTNPPFHVGTAKDSTPTLRIFAEAGRVLRPGGELWAVWNAHLPYLPALLRSIGPTRIVARDPRFIVTRSTRSDPASGL